LKKQQEKLEQIVVNPSVPLTCIRIMMMIYASHRHKSSKVSFE